MIYEIRFTPAARRQLLKLPGSDREKIVKKIDALTVNPRPRGVQKLESQETYYRIRSGNFRVIYSINDSVLLVLIVRIGDRKDIYRGLKS